MRKAPECPECDKMIAVKDKSQVIGGFLEWLQGERGLFICALTEQESGWGEFMREYTSTEQLLAEFFEIDLGKVEQEKRATLEFMREQNG